MPQIRSLIKRASSVKSNWLPTNTTCRNWPRWDLLNTKRRVSPWLIKQQTFQMSQRKHFTKISTTTLLDCLEMMSIRWWKLWISSTTAITLHGSWDKTLIFCMEEGKESTSSHFPHFMEATSIIIATWDLSAWPRCFRRSLPRWGQAARARWWVVSSPKCSRSWRTATSPQRSLTLRKRRKQQRRSLPPRKQRLLPKISNAQRYLTLIKCSSNLKKKINRRKSGRRKRLWRSRVSPVSRRRILPRRATKITLNSLLNNNTLVIRIYLNKACITRIISIRTPTAGATPMPIRPLSIITCYFSTSNIRQQRLKSFPRRDPGLISPNKNCPRNNNIKIPTTRSRCIINKTCSRNSPTITDNTREANPKCTQRSSRHRRTRSSKRQRGGGNDSILISYRHLVL